jgi:hypothetical protein
MALSLSLCLRLIWSMKFEFAEKAVCAWWRGKRQEGRQEILL